MSTVSAIKVAAAAFAQGYDISCLASAAQVNGSNCSTGTSDSGHSGYVIASADEVGAGSSSGSAYGVWDLVVTASSKCESYLPTSVYVSGNGTGQDWNYYQLKAGLGKTATTSASTTDGIYGTLSKQYSANSQASNGVTNSYDTGPQSSGGDGNFSLTWVSLGDEDYQAAADIDSLSISCSASLSGVTGDKNESSATGEEDLSITHTSFSG